MKLATLFLPLSLLFMVANANAASIALTEEDCMEILERYAADPESVPQHLLDACKEMLGAIAPGAGQQKPTADPCADPATANSVQCWGPWAALAPAAAGFKPTDLAAIDEFDTRPELAEALTPELLQLADLPLGECAAGAACGFATIAPGLVAQPDDTSASNIVPFSLDASGSNFQLDPDSVVVERLSSLDGLQSPGFAGPTRFQGSDSDTGSLIIANVNSDTNGALIDATGLWRHGSLANQDDNNTNAGVFAWGVASSQTTLDALNNGGQGTSVTFSGFMASDTRTSANMVVNFGTQPTWSGTWRNLERGFDFGAGGGINGANLLSNSAQFSGDAVPSSDSYVQGILLGARDNQSVAHAINVILNNGDVVKDVGTLRQLQ